jgi:hypothetical protein
MANQMCRRLQEMSGHSGYPADTPLGREAQQFLDSHPISQAQPHMYNWNGGCGAEQMRCVLYINADF